MSFRYSGSKKRLLKYLPVPPADTTIVEPFAGSAAYSLFHRPARFLLAEKNTSVRALWEWLRTKATERDLTQLENISFVDKTDVRKLNLDLPEQTLLRLTTSGVYVGQLSSWSLYRQHKINFTALKALLPWLRTSLGAVASDFRELRDEPGFHFVDPPYLETCANYIDKEKTKLDCSAAPLEDVIAYCKRVPAGILTYGQDAPVAMPDFDWKVAKIVKVPLIRTGGTRERTEHYAHLGDAQ